MSDLKITVAIPVGPHPANKRWLDECLESVGKQSHRADEILLIDDMAGLELPDLDLTIWRSPWLLGVGTAFNCAVGLARHNLVFMLGSDDWLEPDCLMRCVEAYEAADKPEQKYFFVGVKYSDGREDQFLPCNAALVTKTLWQRCGGFPIESASGAPDAALISIMLKHPDAGETIGVYREQPLYNYRVHNETDTAGRQPWQGIVSQTRNILTQLWKPPVWGRKVEIL